MKRKAVVLLSGGLDSATCLAIARHQGYACHTLSLDYGQRHRAELDAAAQIAESLGSVEHKIIRIDLTGIGGSAITDSAIAVPEQPGEDDIPVTYVPARNSLLLTLAAGWAEVLGIQDLFIGVNAVDYSGYPDCRSEFIAAHQKALNLGTKAGVEGREFHIHTPLVELSKAAIIHEGERLGVNYAITVSCYQADDKGRACGRCDACRTRAAGFKEAGSADPTRYR